MEDQAQNDAPAKGRKRYDRHRMSDTVYFHEGKQRWVARIIVGADAKGRTKFAYRVHRTRKEAEASLMALHAEKRTGRVDAPEKLTLGAWLDQWLTTHRKAGAERTTEWYRGLIERHIRPALGHRPIRKLQPSEVEALYAKIGGAQGSARTALGIHQTLRAALRKAVALGVLTESPLDRVEAPRYEAEARGVLNEEQAARFLAALADEPDEVRALATVGLCTGLRLGELTGLRWEDIDLDTEFPEVRVTGQLRTRGTLERAKTKTRKSLRAVPLIAPAVEALRGERSRQMVNGFENAMGLALLNAEGRHWHQKNANAKLRAVCEKAGVPPLSAHALFRHTAATLMIRGGVHLVTASKLLGHSTSKLTADLYAKNTDEASRDAMRRLGSAIRKKQPAKDN